MLNKINQEGKYVTTKRAAQDSEVWRGVVPLRENTLDDDHGDGDNNDDNSSLFYSTYWPTYIII